MNNPAGSCPVFFESKDFSNLIALLAGDQYKNSRKFILADENTFSHCVPLLPEQVKSGAGTIVIPSGEINKNLDSCNLVWEMLTDDGADRQTLLLNVGGGVITDLGGFAASVYKRGIRFLHIPTTLLAMVDASIGGKTGVDYGSLKNHLGTFSLPEAVFVYDGFTATLDARNKKAGIAEMIKHALIADKHRWQEMLQADDLHFYSQDSIRKNIAVKMKIVADDPQERSVRKLLNFGHTIGHAIESLSLKNTSRSLLHGEAVAMGMLCEAWLSCQVNRMPQEELEKIKKIIFRFFRKFEMTEKDIPALMDLMSNDKKNKNAKINFTLLHFPGQGMIDAFPSESKIKESLSWFVSL